MSGISVGTVEPRRGVPSVEQRWRRRVTETLASGERPHLDVQEAPRAGPRASNEVVTRRAGDDVATRAPVGVYRPLDRAQYLRRVLPLVKQQWKGTDRDRRVRVVDNDAALIGPVEAQHRLGYPLRGRCLAHGPGPRYKHGGPAAQIRGEGAVRDA